MKVLHLSTTDFWTQGIHAYRLHKALQKQGIESEMLVLIKSSGDPSVKMLTVDILDKTKIKVVDKVPPNTNTIFGLTVEEWSHRFKKNLIQGEGEIVFSMPESVVNWEDINEIASADIIHIHWVPAMLDFLQTPLWSMGKPIVITLYDMWMFSGGCHLNFDCDKYKQGCLECPIMSDDNLEVPCNNLEIKRKVFSLLNYRLVSPSRWFLEHAKKSEIFKSNDIKIIPYGIPLDVFSKKDKFKVREHLHLPVNKKMVLCCTSSFEGKADAFNDFIEAVRKKLSKEDLSDIFFVFIGSHAEEVKQYSDIFIHKVGFIPHEEVLSWYFSASDVFVRPLFDAPLPISILEAMACGVPIAAFDVNGIREIVEHKVHGYLARKGDFDELVRGMMWLLEKGNQKKITKNVRMKTKKEFALDTITSKYIELYNNILTTPKDIPIQSFIEWGEDLFLNKNIDMALNVFLRLIEECGDHPHVLNNIGVIFWEKGMVTKAYNYFKQAFELEPGDESIRENFEMAKKELGEVEI